MPSPNTAAAEAAAHEPLLDRYDRFAVFLHWTTVVLVLLQFGLAQTWRWFARPTRHEMVVLHMSFGIILSIVVLVRLIWRWTPGHQVTPAIGGLQEQLAKFVHGLLYALLILQSVTGYVLRWSGGESMSFFGLDIPPVIPKISHDLNDKLGDLHNYTGWAIIIVATGHAAVALYHRFGLRDHVLQRMLPARRAA